MVLLQRHMEILTMDRHQRGVNHFTVRRSTSPRNSSPSIGCYPMVPDLIEYRELGKDKAGKDNDPNVITQKIPVVATFRGEATKWMRDNGLANWGLSMGRQPLRTAHATEPSAQFLQNLPMDRLR